MSSLVAISSWCWGDDGRRVQIGAGACPAQVGVVAPRAANASMAVTDSSSTTRSGGAACPCSRAWAAVGGRARRVAAGAASTPSGPVGGLYIQPPQREAASHALERRAAVSSAVSVRLRFRGCRSDVQTLGLPGFAVPRGGGGVTCWLLDDTWLCLGSRVSR